MIGPSLPVSIFNQARPAGVPTAASTLRATPSASRTRRTGTSLAPCIRSRRLDSVSTTNSCASGRIVIALPANRSSPITPDSVGMSAPINGCTSNTDAVGVVNVRPPMTTRRLSHRGVSIRSPVARKPLTFPQGRQPERAAVAGVKRVTPAPLSRRNRPGRLAISACKPAAPSGKATVEITSGRAVASSFARTAGAPPARMPIASPISARVRQLRNFLSPSQVKRCPG